MGRQYIEVWDYRAYMGHADGHKIATHDNVPTDWTPAEIAKRYGIGEHLRIVAVRPEPDGVKHVVLQQGAA